MAVPVEGCFHRESRCLGLQSQLHQPPDRLRPAGEVVLAEAPVVLMVSRSRLIF